MSDVRGAAGPVPAFVLLWTHLKRVGLTKAENLMHRSGMHPVLLPPARLAIGSLPESIADRLATFTGSPDEFDVTAASLLKMLDLRLKAYDSSLVSRRVQLGVDGLPYSVHRTACWIAADLVDRDDAVTWCNSQSLSLRAYCRHHVAVPHDPVEGLQIVPRSIRHWGTPALHARLLAERERLRIMLWPFQRELSYPILEHLDDVARGGFVRFTEVGDEAKLGIALNRALDIAAQVAATILVFPELCFSPSAEVRLRDRLAASDGKGFPLLTAYGKLHQPGDADTWINEAVILGPLGEVLHVHRKLTSFMVAELQLGEGNEKGKQLAVLESAIGNLALLICLDLFNVPVRSALRSSHADVLLVPSLSPKTTAHQEAAKDLRASQLASTFVCNIDPFGGTACSFIQLPLRGDPSEHSPPPEYLLWELG